MEGLPIMDVKVLSVENAGSFFGLALDDSHEVKEFEHWSNYTNENYRNEKPMSVVVQTPNPEKIYCVRSQTDQTWYRTKVETVYQSTNGSLADCYFIDYHRKENINLRWLRECPSEFRRLPTQARKYSLYGIQPITMKTDIDNFTTSYQPCREWDIAAEIFVKKHLTRDRTTVKVEVWKENVDAVQVLVFLAGPHGFICLNEVLVEEKYAIYTVDACKGRTLPVNGTSEPEPISGKGDLQKIFGSIEAVPTQVLKQYAPPRRPSPGQQVPGSVQGQALVRGVSPSDGPSPVGPLQSRLPAHVAKPPQPVAKGKETTVSVALAVLGKSSPINSSDEQTPPKIVRRRTPNSSSTKPKSESQQVPSPSIAELALTGDIYSVNMKTQSHEPVRYQDPQKTPHVVQTETFPGKRLFNGSDSETPPFPVKTTQPLKVTSLGHGQIPSMSCSLKPSDLPPSGRGYGRGLPFSSFAHRTTEQKSSPPAASAAQFGEATKGNLSSKAEFSTPQFHHPPPIQRTATVELPKSADWNNSPSPPRPVGIGRGRGFMQSSAYSTIGGKQAAFVSGSTSPAGATLFVQQGATGTTSYPKPDSSLQLGRGMPSVSQPTIRGQQAAFVSGSTLPAGDTPFVQEGLAGLTSYPKPNSSLQLGRGMPPVSQPLIGTEGTERQGLGLPVVNSPEGRGSASSPGSRTNDVPTETSNSTGLDLLSLLQNPGIANLLPADTFENITQEKVGALLEICSALKVLSKKTDEVKQDQKNIESRVHEPDEDVMPPLCVDESSPRNLSDMEELQDAMPPLSLYEPPQSTDTTMFSCVPEPEETAMTSPEDSFQSSPRMHVNAFQPTGTAYCAPETSNANLQSQYQIYSPNGQSGHGTGSVPRENDVSPNLTQNSANPTFRNSQDAQISQHEQFFSRPNAYQVRKDEGLNNQSEFGVPDMPRTQKKDMSPSGRNTDIRMACDEANFGQSYPVAEPFVGHQGSIPDRRKPVLTSPSMYSNLDVNTDGTDARISKGLYAQAHILEEPKPSNKDEEGLRRLSANMAPSAASRPAPLSVSVGSGDERRSGSDSGSTSTGSRLMSRLPKLATTKMAFRERTPVASSEMPKMIIEPNVTPNPSEKPLRSILKKASPSSVYFSDSDKEGSLPKKKVNLSLPVQKEESEKLSELGSESDTDSDDDLNVILRRECHRSRQLTDLMNPDIFERQYLKVLLSMTQSDFDCVIRNDSGVITDGEMVPKNATLRLESSHLAEYVKNRLTGKNFPLPTTIQSWCWPAILRGLNVIGIAPPKRGKTLAYLAPLASLILQKDSYSELMPGNGPIAIILAASWKSAYLIFDHCKLLLGEISDARTKLIYGDGDEARISVELMNGCEILVATPHCLNRMLQGDCTNFERLCHLVLDDADTLTEDFTDEILSIMSAYNKAIEDNPDRSVPSQLMLFSSQWTAGIRSFQTKCMLNPTVIISSSFEAAIYGRVRQIPDVCLEDQRLQKLPGILDSLSPNHDKIIIFTNTPKEAEEVHRLLQTYCHNALLYSHDMLTEEIEKIQTEWKQLHDEQSKPVLVMTDGGNRELHITDATCVVHYAMSETKTKFGNRLGCMEDHLKVISGGNKRELVSYILISHECARQAPTLLRLLRRIGIEPPRNLELLAAGVMEGREEGKEQPLCHYMKSYGRCRDVNKCPARHVISEEVDQPNPQIPLPKNGEVKVLITHVVNASHYYARIQEHKQFSGPDGKMTKNTGFSSAASMLHFEVLKYFQAESRRVHYEQPRVGELCAVDDKQGVYNRARVLRVPRKLTKDSEMEVIYVDDGRTHSVRLKNMYQLPEHLNLEHIPPIVVEIYVCGVKPKDEDIEWTTKASLWVYELIVGKELKGTIVLSLGTTLWLENLTELVYLPQLKETIHQYSIRKELLNNKLAVKNPEHMSELYKLCQGKVDIPLLTIPKKGGVPKFTYALGCMQTEVLPEGDKYQEVCVSAIETPHLFYVQKYANQDEIDGMCDEINKDTDPLEPVDPNMITAEMLCLAKFTQTDSWYRAKVISMKDNKYQVFFVDYGDKENVTLEQMRTLPERFAKLPLQAIECSLVKVSATGSKWDEAASDAFWDMCFYENSDKKVLYALVNSLSTATHAGMHKCKIELTDTTTGESVFLSQELISAGHALASPDSVQDLFPDLNLDLEHEAEEHEKIPFFSARMYLSTVASESAKLAQTCKDIVAKYNKRDLLRQDSHIAMCKVVAFLAEPTSQYLLLQALFMLLDDDSSKEELYQKGGLRYFCQILSKEHSSLVSQTEVARMLYGFAFDQRYCYEIGYYGGIKHLCRLVEATKQDHRCLIFLQCLSEVCHGYEPNCEHVKDCDGVRVLSRLLTTQDKKDFMKCILELFDFMVKNLESTEIMRKHGAIESLVLNLARTAHKDLIGDIVSLLTTLSGHCQANKKAMREEGISEALEKYCRKGSEEVQTKCRELYRIFNPAGYIDPEPRGSVTRPKQSGQVVHIENTPIIGKDIPSKRVPAEVQWSQKPYSVLLIIKVPEVKKKIIDFKSDGFVFRATVQDTEYYLNLELFQNILPEKCEVRVLPSCVMVGLRKQVKARWIRLLKHIGKPSYIKADLERYVNSSSESECDKPDESPFTSKKKRSLGDILAQDRSCFSKYPDAKPDLEHRAVESSSSDPEYSSDEADEAVFRWADKDPFDIFGDH